LAVFFIAREDLCSFDEEEFHHVRAAETGGGHERGFAVFAGEVGVGSAGEELGD
jgi:hypothetical protein